MPNKRKKKTYKKAHGAKKPGSFQNLIIDFIDNRIGVELTEKQIIKNLGVSGQKSRILVIKELINLEFAGKIKELPNGKFTSIHKATGSTGIVDFVNPRFGYVAVADSEQDIWVSSRDMNGAWHGDEVEVVVSKKGKGSKGPEGKVLKVLKRAKEEFVGRIELMDGFAFVIPDNRKIHTDIYVYPEKTAKANHNDKVIVNIVRWASRDKKPIGEVIRVLGKAGDHNAEIHSIMAEFGLPFEFPNKVEEEAEKISTEITKEEIRKRRDMRDVTTFTIDPLDAKDFDDALSIEKLKNGNYEIGIHIADVSHYVKPSTILEAEAYERATSVYLVDRTIPMLPEKLSNGLCSLRPKEEKLTFSAIFEIDENAKVKKEWFGRTVIYSDRRFTYEEAQERIESKEGDFSDEINLLNGLAHKLKKDRFKKGAISFETVEVKFNLDEQGTPLGLITKVRKDAHKLVEEFMLLANRQVATFIATKGKNKDEKPFVYRTHDFPDPEKLSNFSLFAKRFGHELKIDPSGISNSLNKLMDEIQGKPEQNVLESLAIRSMAKAKYTTDQKGHFGLAFEHYTHFTSPIRRYPDVMVHRLLQHYLDGGKPAEKEETEEKCLHSSAMEKTAAEAERASIKYKQVEYMQRAEEKDYDGVIAGVTEWGIFVSIVQMHCEGMVRMADMTDDFYEFDEKNYRVIGKQNKKMFTLGDEVRVRVKGTDIDRRTIDLEFIDKE